MTRETIEKMEAGKEIDSLVAEKVMGINVVPHGESYEADQMVCNGVKCSVPPYSVNISAAWEIVEKIGQHDAITIDRQSNGSRIEKLWSCSTQFTMTEAPTAPLAICRAALLVTL